MVCGLSDDNFDGRFLYRDALKLRLDPCVRGVRSVPTFLRWLVVGSLDHAKDTAFINSITWAHATAGALRHE